MRRCSSPKVRFPPCSGSSITSSARSNRFSMTESLHGLVVADFNAANLASYLTNNSDAPQLTAAVPGFAQSGAVLADARHECWLPRPAYAVVWTRPDTTIGAFRERLQNRPGASTAILDEVDEYADRLIGVAERTGLVLVPTWTFPGRGLGMLDLRPDLGIGYALMQMNLRLAERLSRTPNVFL